MKIKKYINDVSGVMSIEFALIGPILCLLMLGLIDAGEALMRYRTLTQMSESTVRVALYLSDSATKDKKASINESGLAILKQGVNLIAVSNPMQDLKVSIFQVSKSAYNSSVSSVASVITGSGLTAADYDKESAALSPGESIIICEAEYTQPVFFDVFKAPFKLKVRYSK
jgi:Flp pilus assembly protein TadG